MPQFTTTLATVIWTHMIDFDFSAVVHPICRLEILFFYPYIEILLPAPWIDYLEHLKDFYPIGFFFIKVKVL